jgi:hypothetical protein
MSRSDTAPCKNFGDLVTDSARESDPAHIKILPWCDADFMLKTLEIFSG